MSFFKILVLFFFDTINSLRFKKIIKDEDKKYNKVNDNSYNDNLYQIGASLITNQKNKHVGNIYGAQIPIEYKLKGKK